MWQWPHGGNNKKNNNNESCNNRWHISQCATKDKEKGQVRWQKTKPAQKLGAHIAMNGKKTPNVGHILHCCPHTLTHAHGERGERKGERRKPFLWASFRWPFVSIVCSLGFRRASLVIGNCNCNWLQRIHVATSFVFQCVCLSVCVCVPGVLCKQ